jgi:hypothetical protein
LEARPVQSERFIFAERASRQPPTASYDRRTKICLDARGAVKRKSGSQIFPDRAVGERSNSPFYCCVRKKAASSVQFISPAERHAARLVLQLRPVADGGVEAEELQHALAPRAAARRGLARARGEMPHQQPQALARGVAVPARSRACGRRVEDAVEGAHGLAELPVRLLRRPRPRPPRPPLVRALQQLEELQLQRRVVAPREAPPVGRLDGGEVLGGQARAPRVQQRRVAEPGQLEHVHGAVRGQPRRHGGLGGALQPPDAVRVRQRQQLRPVRGHQLLLRSGRHPAGEHARVWPHQILVSLSLPSAERKFVG